MMKLSSDPKVAERQMHAVIYYLTAFGYIDGDFDESERRYVKDHVAGLVMERAREALGAAVSEHAGTIARWTSHFHEVADSIDHEIAGHFTESVAEGEDVRGFVLSKLKLRALELFRQFDEETRHALLATIDELMLADGVEHPSERRFRDELYRLLRAPIELDDVEIETVAEGALVVGEAKKLDPRETDHRFFRGFESDFAKDPETFARQAEQDLALVQRFTEALAAQRAAGAGRLAGATDMGGFAGTPRFLDGHVYVVPPAPGKAYELLVLGDLHGCYSCLKAALLQADFFAKVQAHHDAPADNPVPYVVFLGDYIDRGRFSYSGILRTVMQLFVTVPEHVFVLRGNHEYYVELNGRVLAPVRPSEAMSALQGIAKSEVFAAYMRLFETLPNMLVFDRTLFVHAGIPRDDTFAEKYTGLPSLNDADIRFQMLWSDPSDTDVVPVELQKATARFGFGRKQFDRFMTKIGCTTMIRGHERIVSGFKPIYEGDRSLLSLFSAGGATNRDLPETSNYREVTPMALTIRHQDGVSQATPFVIDYERYNDPEYNAFFRERLSLV